MDKLQYDNLYKFLVSLGIVLIIVPVAALAFLLNMEPLLISQVDYDSLSDFSLQMIANRNEITSYFISVFPQFAVAFIVAGVGVLIIGIVKWVGLQKNLDKKCFADTEAALQALNALAMSNAEVISKADEEVKEAAVIESPTLPFPPDESARSSAIDKYIKIENLCFNYFTKRYAKKYSFERNIRMGKYCYDFIGVSKLDNIDLVFEIKYIKVAAGNSRRIYDIFERVYNSGTNYETIAHRNFKCVVVIVTPKEELPRLENIVETYCKAHRENTSRIEIKCMAEESL